MRDREGNRKTDNRKRFVGGCDESKSSSHWTELRKSVDREDLREKRKKEEEVEKEEEKEVVATAAGGSGLYRRGSLRWRWRREEGESMSATGECERENDEGRENERHSR